MFHVNGWKWGKIADEVESLNAGVSVNSDASSNGANYYVLKTSAVVQGKVNLNEIKPVIIKDIGRLKCSLKANSILISRMNTPDLVGECGFVERDEPSIFLPDRVWQTTLKKDSKLNCKWLTYLLNTEKMRQDIKNAATGTSNSMKNITKEQILNIEVAYPEPKEQTAIAEALSDADSLITSLEKLIAKKKAIKQGAMQELLTGKKRLPGFIGEWSSVKLGDVAHIRTGDKNNEHKVEGGKYPFFVRSQNIERIDTYSFDGEAIIIPGEGNIGQIFHYIVGKFDFHQRVYKISGFTDGIWGKYAYYQMKAFFGKYALQNTVKATVDSLRLPTFQLFEYLSPPEKTEQIAIATILSDMDAEIEQLEKKLAKYRLIKQGMMQELLTGRIRLVTHEAENVPTLTKKAVKKTSSTHNESFQDAVILVALVNAFGTEQHPFTAFDCQKFPYLLHRHLEGAAKGYGEFAAGPYNPAKKYKTARPIALKKKYIREHTSNYKGFVTDVNAQEALAYFSKWYGDEPLKWMEQFRRIPKRKDELELLTTVDMAMMKLREKNKPITILAVKEYIHQSKEWQAKLKREIFSDANISRAIDWSNELFG